MIKNKNLKEIYSKNKSIDWSWLAGVVDGEGWLWFSNKPYRHCNIGVTNTDLDFLEHAKLILNSQKIRKSISLSDKRTIIRKS